MSVDFYRYLPTFAHFDELTEDAHFAEMPDDWVVFITDIQGSTKAIEAGRYKDVNVLGVASIVAAQNVLDNVPFPYVFGGDGATFVVPEAVKDTVAQALDGVRRLAQDKFGMTLRVGAIAIGELDEGHRVEVAKLDIQHGQCIALFRGGGLTAAENRIKGDIDAYAVLTQPDSVGDLSGLSCRWNPIPSKQGRMLSLLVLARGSDSARVYDETIRALTDIMGGDLANANPINLTDMTYRGVRDLIADERRYHASTWSVRFWARAAEIFVAVLIFKLGWRLPFFDSDTYSADMRVQSDYRKFDDMLRMILDCTADQVEAISTYLTTRHDAGELFFGLYTAQTALMTCVVNDVGTGDHFHFVDGGDGGYAMAAKQLKSQMKSQRDA